MGTRGKTALSVGVGFLAGVLLMVVVDHQPWLLASLEYNFSWDRGWGWVGALSGWIAAAVALPTVFYLRQQVDQVRKSNQDRARGVADTLLIDLQDTASRLPKILYLHHLEPALSSLAKTMISDATTVAPELAVALRRHCSEIAAFEALIRARTQSNVGTIPGELLKDANKLAFRASVLWWSFGVASEKIRKTGVATGPYINRSDLVSFERTYNIGENDFGFLDHLFKYGGIGEK